MYTTIRELTARGYNVTISCHKEGEKGMAIRPEDRAVGRDKQWYCAINNSPVATDYVTGYGDTWIEALMMAVEKAGLKINGITLGGNRQKEKVLA